MRGEGRTPLASLIYPGFLLGLGLFTALVARQGVREVGEALAAAGAGLAVVALFHLLPMLADALGWRTLLARGARPGIGTVLRARWIGESVNGLLPVAQVGGSVAKASWLTRRGVPGVQAGASVVVDVTLVVLTQILFTLLGLSVLVSHVAGARLAVVAGVGAAVMGGLLAGFVAVQRLGAFEVLAGLARRVLGQRGEAYGADAAALDAGVRGLYRERALIAAAAGWHLLSWVVGTGEVWLALQFLGHPVPVRTALLLESLGQAVRAGAFVVPGALGVQEGAFLVLGAALGLPPATAMALSLTKRVREIVLGVPGLVVWQLDVASWRVRRRDGLGGGIIT